MAFVGNSFCQYHIPLTAAELECDTVTYVATVHASPKAQRNAKLKSFLGIRANNLGGKLN